MICHRLFLIALLASLGALVAAGCDSATTVQGEPEPRGGRGATLSVTLLAEKPVATIDAEFAALGFPIRARFAVAIYKIVYETIDADGAATQASGALLVPQEAAGPRPMMTYQHGTLTARDEAPSAGGGEQVIGLAYATDGYLAVLPDLLGLGDSPGLHPYVHAATSASAVIDMLRAARDFAAMDGLELNGQLFITGYSQGGYTAMAAHRELEASYEDEFAVTASAPMAGPYDLSGVMADTFIDGREHPSPYYLAYTLLAYDAIYDLFEDPSDFLVAPYDRSLPPLFDGTHSAGEINAGMPAVPGEILQPGRSKPSKTTPLIPCSCAFKRTMSTTGCRGRRCGSITAGRTGTCRQKTPKLRWSTSEHAVRKWSWSPRCPRAITTAARARVCSSQSPGSTAWSRAMTDLVDPVDLYLVRHGQARAADGSYDHRTSLSALGRRQAAAVAEALASTAIAAVYSSPSVRALETAQPLAAATGLTTQVEERLLEFEIDGWNPDAEDGQKGDWQIWRPDHRGSAGGETIAAFAERVGGAFDELVERHAGAAVAVVSHAGTTDAAIRWAMGMPSDSEWCHDFELLNASISEIRLWPRGRHPEGAPRHATIRRAPNLDHLPAELRSDF